MCLLALLYRVVDDAPVVVGANREEYYQRGGEPPRRLAGTRAVAGVDPLAGGTWLGVNDNGLVVAVTNRRKTNVSPEPRSRGLLARELLGHATARSAVQHAVSALEQGPYAGCNFLCVDPYDAVVIHAGDWLRVRPLPPGIHVLTNRDVNDPMDVRAVYSSLWLSQRAFRTSADCVLALEELCAAHQPTDSPVCYREAERGTVSSTILTLPADLAKGTMYHAQGPPDRTPYANCSYLLSQLAAGRE